MTYRILHKSKEMMRVYFFFFIYTFLDCLKHESLLLLFAISPCFVYLVINSQKKGLVLGFKLTGDVRLC